MLYKTLIPSIPEDAVVPSILKFPKSSPQYCIVNPPFVLVGDIDFLSEYLIILGFTNISTIPVSGKNHFTICLLATPSRSF